MTVFADYARYYDLLYRDKPYEKEAAYIRNLIRTHIPDAKRILELGCGTGIHAEYLARAGMAVSGVDFSEWMLERARSRRSTLSADVAERLNFTCADVRHVRLPVRADVVVSLFHVMSYQTENADLQAVFATAREHVRPGGIFLFDVWYGPAVLTDRPSVRVKKMEDGEVQITRTAEPVLYANENRVDVHYRIVAVEKSTGCSSETSEVHRMRYLFWPELKVLAENAGFTLIGAHEWMTGRVPSFETWSVCFVCRA